MPEQNVIDAVKIVCERCGEEFEMSPAEQKFYNAKGFHLPKRCKKCRELRRDTEEIVCKDCNCTFTLSKLEKERYDELGMQYPKRCKKCREFKRQHNAEIEQE